MKRDYQAFSLIDDKDNFYSKHYFLFKSSLKLHNDLGNLANSIRSMNSTYLQPNDFQKLYNHYQNRSDSIKNEVMIPIFLKNIEKSIKLIGFKKENEIGKKNEDHDDNKEAIEINLDPQELKKKTQNLQNILNQGNISFEMDNTFIEEQPLLLNNFTDNLPVEKLIENDNPSWEDWVFDTIRSYRNLDIF
jgi:hypothetical protein